MGQITIENEKTYQRFITPKIEHYKSNARKIKSVKLKMISHDEYYEKLCKEGKQIDITNVDFEYGKTGRKTIDGIFSPRFGPDNDSDAPIFSCDCHKTTGSIRAGQICPECGTEVRSIDADLRLVGHIDIYPYYIMTYHGVNALSSVIKPLSAVYTSTSKIDLKGKLVNDGKLTIMDIYNNYDEVYYPITKLKKKYAFTSKIPVYSSRLRPWIKNGMSVSVLKVNTRYQSIVTMRRDLLSISGIKAHLQVQRTLNQIQQDFLAICDHIKKQLGGKTGIIRRFMASGRVDYSSRMVVKLGQHLMPHEIEVPYQTMMTIYEEEIINRYARLHSCSTAQAISAYTEALGYYNQGFANIMRSMCREKDGVWAIIIRNPTINEMGTPYVKIKTIHDEYEDYTMDVPPDVLTPMGADFDGDQLTLAAVKDPKIGKHFKCFTPTYMFIDRATGYFNSAMGFKKDYAATLSQLWDIDTAINEYLMDPNETSEFTLSNLGIQVHDLTPEEYKQLDDMYNKASKSPKGWPNRQIIIGEGIERYV